MNGDYLLDTNAVTDLLDPRGTLRDSLPAGAVLALSATVLGELYFGAYKSSRVQQNIARFSALAVTTGTYSCDAATADQYGRIKDELRRKGRPIPENDMWIAAVARQHGLTLATRDGHFDDVDGLQRFTW